MNLATFTNCVVALLFGLTAGLSFAFDREDHEEKEHAWAISITADGGVRKSPLIGDPGPSKDVRFRTQLSYYGERFFLDDEIGFTFYQDDKLMVNMIGSASEDAVLFHEKFVDLNVPELQGLEKRQLSLDGGVEILYEDEWGEMEFQLETDLQQRHQGHLAELNYAYTFSSGKWGFRPQVGVVWKSQNYVDYFYGVRPSEVRTGRPEYTGRAALDWTLLFESKYSLTHNWNILGVFYYERGSPGITDSPLIVKNHYMDYFVGVEWSQPFSIQF